MKRKNVGVQKKAKHTVQSELVSVITEESQMRNLDTIEKLRKGGWKSGSAVFWNQSSFV
jgi:hypothetical protein